MWDNIKMNLQEVGYDVIWMGVTQDRDKWRAYAGFLNTNKLVINKCDHQSIFSENSWPKLKRYKEC